MTKPGFDVVDLRPRRCSVKARSPAGSCQPVELVEQRRERGAITSITFAAAPRSRSGSTPCGRPRRPTPRCGRGSSRAPRSDAAASFTTLRRRSFWMFDAADADRRRRADVRLRRHREHVGRLADPDAGRRCARAVRARRRRSPGSSTRAPSGRSCASSPRARRACRARSRPRRSRRRSPGRAG